MSPSYSQDHLGSVWYYSKLQRALIPQTRNWSGTIFCPFLQQTRSRCIKGFMPNPWSKILFRTHFAPLCRALFQEPTLIVAAPCSSTIYMENFLFIVYFLRLLPPNAQCLRNTFLELWNRTKIISNILQFLKLHFVCFCFAADFQANPTDIISK